MVFEPNKVGILDLFNILFSRNKFCFALKGPRKVSVKVDSFHLHLGSVVSSIHGKAICHGLGSTDQMSLCLLQGKMTNTHLSSLSLSRPGGADWISSAGFFDLLHWMQSIYRAVATSLL